MSILDITLLVASDVMVGDSCGYWIVHLTDDVHDVTANTSYTAVVTLSFESYIRLGAVVQGVGPTQMYRHATNMPDSK